MDFDSAVSANSDSELAYSHFQFQRQWILSRQQFSEYTHQPHQHSHSQLTHPRSPATHHPSHIAHCEASLQGFAHANLGFGAVAMELQVQEGCGAFTAQTPELKVFNHQSPSRICSAVATL